MITLEELRALPLLSDLKDAELEEIASSAADIHLPPGAWLVQEGDQPAFFLLLSGELEVIKNVVGDEQIITRYQAGDYFGEVPLLLGANAVASLRASSPIRALRLSETSFHHLMTLSEKLAAHILRTMTRRVAHLQQLSVEAPKEVPLIVGHLADLDCYGLRQFLSNNRQEYRWLDPDDPNVITLLPEATKDGPYPVVVLTDGSLLRAPSKRTLAESLGLQTAPKREQYDVVVIGGGPAGLSAAVYGASEGLSALLVEREAPGGQAGTSSRIENYLGFPTGLSGGELAARALQQAKRFGTEVVVTREVKQIRLPEKRFEVILDEDTCIQARTLIIATGVSWRSLAIPGADALLGKGIYYGAARTEALGVRDKNIYLVGGGNSAGQSALFFADYACKVTLLIRAAAINTGMSEYLIDQLAMKENIFIELNTSVVSVQGEEQLEAITVQYETESGQTETKQYETDALFVFIGADAETDWLPNALACDDRGYLLTGSDVQSAGKWDLKRDPFLLETSIPGIFAAGDVRHGSVKRVASSVGEGSMAITFIHRFLAMADEATKT